MLAYVDFLIYWFLVSIPLIFLLIFAVLNYRHLFMFYRRQSDFWHESSDKFLTHLIDERKAQRKELDGTDK